MEENRDGIKEIMKMAKLEMPFDDFDAKVMADIEKIEAEKESISKSRKYALIFFAAGTFFGICLNYLVTELIFPKIIDIQLRNYLGLFSQIIYVILIVLFSDKILKLRRHYKNPEL